MPPHAVTKPKEWKFPVSPCFSSVKLSFSKIETPQNPTRGSTEKRRLQRVILGGKILEEKLLLYLQKLEIYLVVQRDAPCLHRFLQGAGKKNGSSFPTVYSRGFLNFFLQDSLTILLDKVRN
jgi:hypothetical protein